MTLIRIFGSTFCELTGVLMLMPVLTVRLAARGEPSWLIGLFGAALYVAIFAVTPFAARCTRRFGLRRLYILSGFSPLLGVAVLGLTEHTLAWLLAVTVMGVFGGLRWVTAEAYVAGAAPAARRGAVIGAFQTMVGGCFVLGPLLLTVTGTAGVAPLVVAAALLTTGLLCLIGLAELPALPSDAATGAFRRLQHERPVLLLAALIGGTLESGPTTFLPVEALADGFSGRTADALVAVLGVGGLLVQFPLGWLADRYSAQPLLRICAWLALSAALLLLFNAQIPVVLWVAAFLWGAAGAGIYTLAMIDVGRAYSGVALVGATAALVFAYAIGAAISPALAGLVMIWWPQTGFAALMSVVAVAGLCVIPRTSPARHSSPPTMPVE